MIEDVKWLKPDDYIKKQGSSSGCFVCINGQVFKARTTIKPYNDVGFNVYHYDKFSSYATFFRPDDKDLQGATLDYGQDTPVLR